MAPPVWQEVYSQKAFSQKALEHAALVRQAGYRTTSHFDVTTANNVILRTQNHHFYESIFKQVVERLNGCPM